MSLRVGNISDCTGEFYLQCRSLVHVKKDIRRANEGAWKGWN